MGTTDASAAGVSVCDAIPYAAWRVLLWRWLQSANSTLSDTFEETIFTGVWIEIIDIVCKNTTKLKYTVKRLLTLATASAFAEYLDRGLPARSLEVPVWVARQESDASRSSRVYVKLNQEDRRHGRCALARAIEMTAQWKLRYRKLLHRVCNALLGIQI